LHIEIYLLVGIRIIKDIYDTSILKGKRSSTQQRFKFVLYFEIEFWKRHTIRRTQIILTWRIGCSNNHLKLIEIHNKYRKSTLGRFIWFCMVGSSDGFQHCLQECGRFSKGRGQRCVFLVQARAWCARCPHERALCGHGGDTRC